MSTKKPIFATIFAILGIALLLKMSFWQVERLAWKNDLIASIDHEYAKDVSAFPITKDNIAQIYADLAPSTVYRGVAAGKIDLSKALSFVSAAPMDGRPGYSAHSDFILDGEMQVIMNLGWVFFSDKEATISKMARFDEQEMSFTVTLRKPPKNVKRYPYLFDADAHPELEGVVLGSSAKPVLRSKHKSYAIFWFTMALVLAVFYVLRFGREWRKD